MVKSFLINIIRLYQRYLSPFKQPCCRFEPTCSQFACEAIATFGPAKGMLLALWRILRCHPFHPGGYDPVDKYCK
ncbi:MAG TPA: membrane protein insertion efficiency factor YidD [Deltaproteobacteria bacterium]|nr:MAG: membrane protein insertion efficiency factor YidD [Deltaproteobacteria bacterium]RLB06303.1 MAG: membrane protein insertion efficiency factor YidD [Deltaproteobacteria bacterium]HDM77494.1 membrane protein insertion efficiency factor YidD [Deltaproteobacteria bacterium]HEC30863.1 membrane protein insertion efficiency factor YidD [Deltaproteobacteria bacterium]